jgi:hypothetical protein
VNDAVTNGGFRGDIQWLNFERAQELQSQDQKQRDFLRLSNLLLSLGSDVKNELIKRGLIYSI